MTDEQAEIHGEENESTTLFIVDMFYRVERERDEAREQNTKLRDIAERAINAIDDQFRCVEKGIWITNKLKQQLRAKLDQLKGETK